MMVSTPDLSGRWSIQKIGGEVGGFAKVRSTHTLSLN
jgi:hypothetical protein